MFPVGLQTQEAEINLVRATESFPDKMHFTFANGVENGPTTVMVWKDFVCEAFYHLSPAEDVALTSILLRPSPIVAVSKVNFSTSKRGYGSVPRVYVKTEKDRSFSPKEQHIAVTKSLTDKQLALRSDLISAQAQAKHAEKQRPDRAEQGAGERGGAREP
ncbi:methylesterase 18 [Selaginella moellendorffii]|uniref:methylesterase 18 n=1 Tax=Selaginella moellendorffii TaxID=88036 RepID=UPI000D1C7590|nr:methylesterase 18 [Selaginella moellendorffii]|eukprot:XP_024540742.1 methylesterase 18 [Selaginella moellendorffii]